MEGTNGTTGARSGGIDATNEPEALDAVKTMNGVDERIACNTASKVTDTYIKHLISCQNRTETGSHVSWEIILSAKV